MFYISFRTGIPIDNEGDTMQDMTLDRLAHWIAFFDLYDEAETKKGKL